jgi:hypothetical protein
MWHTASPALASLSASVVAMAAVGLKARSYLDNWVAPDNHYKNGSG